MEWYNVIRHSVDVKIMVRFPKMVLLVKAQMLYQEYLASCLLHQLKAETVTVNRRWLNEWLDENRIASLRPNRKFKVPRAVLALRLMLWWIAVAKIRKLVQLHFGYEPEAKNVDQSPFHMNEAGSQECNTLALKGAPTVPLIENHAATRERWSLNSITDSCIQRVERELPGFELMFKAQGKDLEPKLQSYVASKHLPFKVSVVTGPSGSYKEHDILNFIEGHLEATGRWEMFFLDAYGPGLTNNCQRSCWLRGKILITHGGGASMVSQTNDTDLHLWVRKRFVELQQDLILKKARRAGGGLVDTTREENIDLMIEVMSQRELHVRAARGYKYTGTMVALDGSEDYKICREAKYFWSEMDMRRHINAAVAEVEAKFQAGELPWSFKTVQSLLPNYPKTRHLDTLRRGQDDEATEDPDGVPWEVEEEQHEEAADDDDDWPAFDPRDWAEGCTPTAGADVEGGALHGDGDVLSPEQAEGFVAHSTRLKSLHQAKEILASLGGTVGASLRETVCRVEHDEAKRFRERSRTDPILQTRMSAFLEADEAHWRRERAEFQEHMRQVKQKQDRRPTLILFPAPLGIIGPASRMKPIKKQATGVPKERVWGGGGGRVKLWRRKRMLHVSLSSLSPN